MNVIRNVEDEPKKAPAYATCVATTLYGCNYLAMIMDKTHVTWKFNKIHTAAYALRSRSTIIVAMAATPVMTKLQVSFLHPQGLSPSHDQLPSIQDLWIMGHVMDIRPFFDKSKYDQMTKDLNHVQARDRRAEHESDKASNHLRAVLSSQDPHELRKTEFYPKLQTYIPQIREAFYEHVICRTLDSVDYRGQKIFGMRPYLEHVMLIELRQWEKQALTALTDEMVQEAPITTLIGAGKVSFQLRPGSSTSTSASGTLHSDGSDGSDLEHPCRQMNPWPNGKTWHPPNSMYSLG